MFVDLIKISICTYAMTVATEIALAVLQHLAQFRETTKEMKDFMSEDKIDKAASYAMAKSKFKIFECVYVFAKDAFVILNLGLIYSHLECLKGFRDVSFLMAIYLIDQVVRIPTHLFNDFVVEAKFGYNNKTFGTWVKDFFMETIVSLILMFPLYLVILELLNKFATFYIHITIFVTLFRIFLYWIYPSVIAPLFNKFEPFDTSKPLYKKIQDLAKNVKFEIDSMFVMDGSRRSGHSNAYFTGFGKKKRIVFYDTLLSQLKTDNQVLGVLCHEFGHFKFYHIWTMLFFDTFTLFTGLFIFNRFYFLSPFPPAITVFLFMLILSPAAYFVNILKNYLSRRNERQADKFAVDNGFGEDLKESLKILVEENSSTLKNNYCYLLVNATHPTALERCETIKELLKKEE